MNIYLVRHGESEGNVDRSVHLRKADHAIELSENGHRQAMKSGKFLAEYLSQFYRTVPLPHFRVWFSPYTRTRQTALHVINALKKLPHKEISSREHVLLCEQQFGLFDGIPEEELPKLYPEEHAHYKKQEDWAGRFWARMPLGESRFDVATRVHQAFGTFHRDADRHDIKNIVVVCHGVTMRAFVMMWLHYEFEWVDKQPNPPNCSIWHICDGVNMGLIYNGPEEHERVKHMAVTKYGGPF